MASASTPFALTPPGLCFPSPCSPGRQTTCTRHERARDKNKRRSPRGYAETVKSWRVWSFLFPHGDETPTRSLPLPFFRLLSSSPASPPSPHLPSFLQPTKQVSFPSFIFGCRAVRGRAWRKGPGEKRQKKKHRRSSARGASSTFPWGGPRNQRALSKSSRAVCDAFRSLVLVSVDVEPRTTLRCMPLCGSVDGGKRGETKPARSLSRGFPVDESRRPKKSSVQSNTPTPPPITTAMADAPVIAPKSAFEDRWNGIVRPYSQVSENTWGERFEESRVSRIASRRARASRSAASRRARPRSSRHPSPLKSLPSSSFSTHALSSLLFSSLPLSLFSSLPPLSPPTLGRRREAPRLGPGRAHPRPPRRREALGAHARRAVRAGPRRALGRPGRAERQGGAQGDLLLGLAGRRRRQHRGAGVPRPVAVPGGRGPDAGQEAQQGADARRPDRARRGG